MFAGTTMKSLIFYFEWLHYKVFNLENKDEIVNWEIRSKVKIRPADKWKLHREV